jgi:hypothetical protein
MRCVSKQRLINSADIDRQSRMSVQIAESESGLSRIVERPLQEFKMLCHLCECARRVASPLVCLNSQHEVCLDGIEDSGGKG